MEHYHNPWDERYSAAEYVYGTEPNDFLRQHAHLLTASSRVLCLADGEGRNGVYLASLGHLVTSVDSSAVGLVKAQQLAKQQGVNITTICADLASFNLGNQQWDAIISIFFHLPLPLRSNVHRAIDRALVPGGMFLLEAYTPEQLQYKTGGPPTEELLMTCSQLRSELAPLVIESCHEQTRAIHEGILHNGMSAVVQVVGRRSER